MKTCLRLPNNSRSIALRSATAFLPSHPGCQKEASAQRATEPGGRGAAGLGLTCRPAGADRGPGEAARATEGRLASCNEIPLLDSVIKTPLPLPQSARPPHSAPPHRALNRKIHCATPARAAHPPAPHQSRARPRPRTGGSSACASAPERAAEPAPRRPPSSRPLLRAAPKLPPFRGGGGSANLTSRGGESSAPTTSASRGTAHRARTAPPLFPAVPDVTRKWRARDWADGRSGAECCDLNGALQLLSAVSIMLLFTFGQKQVKYTFGQGARWMAPKSTTLGGDYVLCRF